MKRGALHALAADFAGGRVVRRSALRMNNQFQETLMALRRHGQKVNFDRQIVAIAKVNRASLIYTDDGNMIKFAKRGGIETISSWELPKQREKQADLFEEQKEKRTRAATASDEK